MQKPDTIHQAVWDRLTDKDKTFVIDHERQHATQNQQPSTKEQTTWH